MQWLSGEQSSLSPSPDHPRASLPSAITSASVIAHLSLCQTRRDKKAASEKLPATRDETFFAHTSLAFAPAHPIVSIPSYRRMRTHASCPPICTYQHLFFPLTTPDRPAGHFLPSFSNIFLSSLISPGDVEHICRHSLSNSQSASHRPPCRLILHLVPGLIRLPLGSLPDYVNLQSLAKFPAQADDSHPTISIQSPTFTPFAVQVSP